MLAGRLGLALSLLLGVVELHSHVTLDSHHGESGVVHLQAPDCVGSQSQHVDAAGATEKRDCPSCLHRLQTRGGELGTAVFAAPLCPRGGLLHELVLAFGSESPLTLAARGPPAGLLLG
jgi:hypothetical protein